MTGVSRYDFRAAPTGWLVLQGRGDFLWGFDGDTTSRIEETSIRLGWPQATLEAGRGAIVAWLTKNFRVEGRLVYESISNKNGVAGKDATDGVFQAALSYQYR